MQGGIGIDANEVIKKNIGYFDNHSELYEDASTKSGELNPFYCGYLKNLRLSVLDVGGGDGSFCRLLIDNFPELDVNLLEPSKNLISSCKDIRIRKVQGSLPHDLSLEPYEMFDYIFIRFVLHHLAADSISSSRDLVKESLLKLKAHLKPNGYLIVSETFFESRFKPTLMRNALFYSLNIQNYLGLRIPHKDFQLGLRVCFYTRNELKQLFYECGFAIKDSRVHLLQISLARRSILSAWGFMDYILILRPIDDILEYSY